MAYIEIDIRGTPVVGEEDLVQAYNREASPVIARLREEANKNQGNLTPTSAAYAILSTDRNIIVADSVAITVTLPPAADVQEHRYMVKKAGNSGDVVTVSAQSGETIDSSLTVALSTTYGWLEVLSDGTEWLKVSEGP